MNIEPREFGQLRDGRNVRAYTLSSDAGMQVEVLEFGGIITRLMVPDREGKPADVVLGFDRLADYQSFSPYFGALIGRFGNRIGGAQFELDGRTYCLAANDGRNHLHGGLVGYDKVLWQVEPIRKDNRVSLVMRFRDEAGREGYPGTVGVTITYSLTPDNSLTIDYHAITDAPTHVNLTQHSYFNLAGHDSGDVLGQTLQINASHYLPVDDSLIPKGPPAPVDGAMDFRHPKPIGQDMAHVGGYDHNYCLDGGQDRPPLVAIACDPASGRTLEIRGTQPGVQLYTSNGMDIAGGKGGTHYRDHAGFCLETQHYPDTPHRKDFPSTLLQPGQTYHHQAIWKFSTV